MGMHTINYESESVSHLVISNALQPHGLEPARLLCPWNSPSKNTGVGSHSLLQRIFPTQGLNPGFPHCRQILYQLSHKGRPRILEWVGCPFSSGFSQLGNWNGVSCIASRWFTTEPPEKPLNPILRLLKKNLFLILGFWGWH